VRPILVALDLPILGRVEFPSFLTLVLAGFLVAVIGARRAAGREGIDGERIVDLALLCLVLGIVGARLLAVLTDGKLADFVHLCTDPGKVSGNPPRDCLAVLKFWQGGLTWYGGLAAAVPGAIWYCRRKKLDFLRVADLLAPFLLVGQAFGRIGCFLDGCCYGSATSGPLGVDLPGRPAPVHPTQLYEAAADLALAALLAFALRSRARGRGELFGWMLVLYAAMRSGLELLRADPRGSLGPLSTSQLLAIPALALGVWLVARARRGGQPEAESVE
jgi:phosphatidylglycerol---prolipoprotein diacylglyceryl transferase